VGTHKIALVGEAYGETEERLKMPFVGNAGRVLTELLTEAGINRAECFITNVFNLRPAGNKIEALCGSKKDVGKLYPLPMLKQGKYILQQYLPELDRLKQELEEVQPNLVIALGNTACWALLRNSGITSLRGTINPCVLVAGLKVLPTFHPSSLFHQPDNRPVTVLDLIKAENESHFPEIRYLPRLIHVAESIADCEWIYQTLMSEGLSLVFDIETYGKQITCIGFTNSIDKAYVIPFIDFRKPGCNYWPTLQEEVMAVKIVRKILMSPLRKSGQNGLYDMSYLWFQYGIPVINYEDDSMLLHHALQPEAPKSLGFMGSIYTSERAWKTMRNKHQDELKADE
jgi:uracil-DNA glycosylase